jgi:hypothetical protein
MLDYTTELFRDELNPGERILWTGQPSQGLMFHPADAFLIPFSLLWGGFAIFWESTVIASGGPFFFMLWGIPFVLIGLYFIAGRFFVDMQQRKNTWYALTDERVIIISGLFSQNTKTISLKNLTEVNLSVKSDGRGTITFGPSHPMAWLYGGTGLPSMGRYQIAPGLDMIPNARNVYKQIRQLQKQTHS